MPIKQMTAAVFIAASFGVHGHAAASDPAKTRFAAPGRIEGATEILRVGTAATGVVSEFLVQEGERVVAGQPLARLDCRVVDAELAARAADAAGAKAAYARVKNGPRPGEIEIAEADVRSAMARATEAKAALQRLLDLPDKTITTRAQLLATERDAKASAAQLDGAKARLAMLRAGSRSEDVDEARARLEVAEATLDQALARQDQCTVRAPIGGIVVQTNATVGEMISPSMPAPVLRLVDDSRLKVRAEVDERDLGHLCMGQEAAVTAEGFKESEYPARVERINPGMGRRSILSADPAEKSDRDVLEVVLSLNDEPRALPIGLRVSVLFRSCGKANGEMAKK
jgi:HlyD family secretion protein